MTQDNRKEGISIVIVGFRISDNKSVFYQQLDGLVLGSSDDERLLSAMKSVLEKSDSITIRCLDRRESLVEGCPR